MAAPIPNDVTAYQNNWRFCVHCCGLWWNGRADNGACPSTLLPAGNPHRSPNGQHHGPSWDFILPANPSQSI
jgi:hypothetical protein